MKKILCIEDEIEQADIIKHRLKKIGYEFITAADGEEGLEKAYQEKPDLILLDVFLPKANGLEVCKTLKSDSRTKDIPVIIITASGVTHIRDQARNAKADACILKPYELPDLIAKIKVLLKEIE